MIVRINKTLSKGRIKINPVSRELSLVERGRNYGERPHYYSETEPETPFINQIWVDISSEPNTEKRWDGVEWITVGSSGSGSGDVTGPVSSTNENIVIFDGTTGKKIKDGGKNITDFVEKETGKGLSSNDYTTSEKEKLAGIENQIQSDWNQGDEGEKDFIKNKPSIPASQIQSDWNQTNEASLDFIKNKPSLNFDPAGSASQAESNAKSYADGLVTKVWKDQGAFSAFAGNYPAASDTTNPISDHIIGGMIWTISVSGTINGVELSIGDTIRSIKDNPSPNWTDWVAMEGNLGYTPENKDNKITSLSETPSNTKYPAESLMVTELGKKVTSQENYSLVSDTEITKLANIEVATAENDVLIGSLVSGVFKWVKKTISELKTALGLGGAAYLNVGTVSSTVCAGDDGRLSDYRTDTNAFHKNGSSEIYVCADKSTPEDADLFLAETSAGSAYTKIKVSWTNIKATLKTYFDGVYGAITLKMKVTSDQTTTSNSLGDVTGLSAALDANSTYRISGSIHCGCGGAGGIKLGINHSNAGATSLWVGLIRGTTYTNDTISALNTATNAFYVSTANTVYLMGTIKTGANTGNLTIQFCSGTNGQTSTVYELGTCLIVEKIG